MDDATREQRRLNARIDKEWRCKGEVERNEDSSAFYLRLTVGDTCITTDLSDEDVARDGLESALKFTMRCLAAAMTFHLREKHGYRQCPSKTMRQI